MYYFKHILTLSTLAYSASALDQICGNGRFGGVTYNDAQADDTSLYNAYLSVGYISFAPNAGSVTYQSGETALGITHDQGTTAGNVDVSEVLDASYSIQQDCIIANTDMGIPGVGGQVTGVQGRGASDGTFTVTIFSSPATSKL